MVDLFQIYNNSIKMLRDRGNSIGKVTNIINDSDTFYQKYKKEELIIISDDYKTFLFINKPEDNFIKKHQEKLVKKAIELTKKNVVSLIVVLERKVNTNIVVAQYENKKIYVSFMFHWELMFDPTSHELVPQHILLSKEAEKELLKNSTIYDKNNLPVILSDDRIARWYGAVPKQIFFIRRKNKFGFTEVIYRIVKTRAEVSEHEEKEE